MQDAVEEIEGNLIDIMEKYVAVLPGVPAQGEVAQLSPTAAPLLPPVDDDELSVALSQSPVVVDDAEPSGTMLHLYWQHIPVTAHRQKIILKSRLEAVFAA